ncbi:transcriptional regulator, HxlR family [Chitinophaga terrae (ex Kim and Jung 2007)]|uniref:Transcriptional regulator, HxlR family n=1 Tax=Chitinophaga terrae (ex Kim and Jung 2007) TaxID=408074 RepID=A0A1H4BYN1_9BACT|nr:winged helix-turn-helix transcriptional regulator [Chitinophaga terrae (ex Kim and Jung 2007)]MDQ0108614.1 DNA-binding HxlR family transcriptional regulator [Chitinophaga terrae (ex Kim and Jung 2007)]GEP91917.1 HxlR family transcriptional regulator [Chitinophaga terrae (ex Kim and Jung 2007)]SEA53199.1 transcriptional regulator, HxlR family [Chitinophaga terrae (ex Kim and Jung 2007)]
MTTHCDISPADGCPAERLLKALSGKWKAQIFRLAVDAPVRFNALLRQLNGANKQSLATALKELEEEGLLEKEIVQQKPLNIQYTLSEKAKSLIPVFRQLDRLA